MFRDPVIDSFGAPILVEEIENGVEIADKFCELSRKKRDEDDHGGLVSDAWREARLAKDRSEYDKYGYTSFAKSNLADEPEFNFIHKAAIEQYSKYLDMFAKKACSFDIGNSWCTIYGNGHYVPEHIHPNSNLSCVFYGDASDDTGRIIFKNPMYPSYAMNHMSGFGLMTDSVFVQPLKGMMIIFPSFIPHYTTAHLDDKERIIFSCNANLKTTEHYQDKFSVDGVLNRDDTSTEYKDIA
tara:strand:+ start:550 stop:1269 length:720 start_codon:yes stop_codon:yes gene_type:complete